jgi:uncharacterized protein YodC (DUF2158 family)
MSDTEFKPGNIVRLRSGGPVMTIDSAGSFLRTWKCRWFSKEEKLHEEYFSESSLEYERKPVPYRE